MKQVDKKYRCVPFWSWNDTLKAQELIEQIEWMNGQGVGGFFMHARGGLKTEYLGKEWFECIDACGKRAKELGMEAYAYDENGWPSGFAGGKLLEDIENHDRYLTYKIGKYDQSALASYEIKPRSLKRTKGCKGECLNVYEHYSASTADILNPEVVDKFIELTHAEYKKRDTYELKGFFTDEPQYYRWGMPYTKMLPEYFEREYGEDILDGLGLLFLKKRGYRDFRYKFWRALQTLMLKGFAEKIYNWCNENGYKLTGHYIEESFLAGQMDCCAGIMPFYEYEHIPGIDYLGVRITEELGAKQASSVASQLGKKQVLTETFAACGWDITPLELKMIAESQYVAGVNLMCQHLLPYKEHGQRKRDYPSHFSAVNPWVKKGFKTFNDYFSYLGMTLAESEEIVNVGVLHPIRSAYFEYDRFTSAPYSGLEYLERPFFALMTDMCRRGIGHHYLDETLLEKYGRVEGKRLILGNCAYDFVVIPKIHTMDKATEKLLRQYGGKVLLYSGKPEYLEGKRHSYKYLKSNTSWGEIEKTQPYSIKTPEGTDIRCAYRVDRDGREFIYAVNLGNETVAEIIPSNGKSFESYDIESDTYKPLPTTLRFDKGQSYLLYVSSKETTPEREKMTVHLGKSFTVEKEVENSFTIDMLRFSTDGESYSDELHHMCVLDRLLKKKYEGKLYLKYQVKINTPPKKCSLLTEYSDAISVTVNSQQAGKATASAFEVAGVSYDIADLLRTGENEIVIEIDYFQSEQVYYALFGENVTESLKNCLAYDTDIEPVYLRGDFGVYGTFEQGEDEKLIFGKDFYLDTQKRQVECLITDGYPFFSGDISLTQEIEVPHKDCQLVLDGMFHMAEIFVNGNKVGEMMLSYRKDLTPYLKKGKNQLKIVLTVGNRNLLGPFHNLTEHGFIGPDTFERFGSWDEKGESPRFNPEYSFKKTLI